MYREMFDLRGEVALIVGGAGDIPGACAMGLAEFGANIVVADINLAAAEQVAEKVAKMGVTSVAMSLNITNPAEIETVVHKTMQQFGKIDILLNGVGATVRKPALDITTEEWLNIINVNLNSAFILSKAVAKEMIREKKGKMIHISSTGAVRPGVNFSAYGASKAGQVHLIKALALELAPYRINVNAIAPTATETGFTNDYYAKFPERKEATCKNHPFGRLGRPEDYVGAAIYLASHASDFVNGHVIVVDSGKTI